MKNLLLSIKNPKNYETFQILWTDSSAICFDYGQPNIQVVQPFNFPHLLSTNEVYEQRVPNMMGLYFIMESNRNRKKCKWMLT